MRCRGFALSGLGLVVLVSIARGEAALDSSASPRSPDQIAAFYEARGFPSWAIQALRTRCFVTFVIENSRDERLVMDLDQWTVERADETVPIHRWSRWEASWRERGLPRRHRSTLRWTLLPEERVLYPGEQVGGNLVFPRGEAAVTVTARFPAASPGESSPSHRWTFDCPPDRDEPS